MTGPVGGCFVVQSAVLLLVVVVFPPGLDQDPGLLVIGEQSTVQALASQLVVEALRLPVLPGAPRLGVHGLDRMRGKPRLQGFGDELRPVVASQVLREASASSLGAVASSLAEMIP